MIGARYEKDDTVPGKRDGILLILPFSPCCILFLGVNPTSGALHLTSHLSPESPGNY